MICGRRKPLRLNTQKLSFNKFYNSEFLWPLETANNRLQQKLKTQKFKELWYSNLMTLRNETDDDSANVMCNNPPCNSIQSSSIVTW